LFERGHDVREYFDFLRHVYFFKDLSEEEIELIASNCKEDRFEAGEVIFLEGTQGERFFIVLDGHVEVWKDYQSQDPDMLAIHGPGHLFGELALIDDLPRSASVVARTDTRVLYLFREEFTRIFQENSSVALSILRSVSDMVRKSNQSFVDDLRQRNRELEAAYSELKAAQEELIRSERFSNLGKFSSMIIHDIRNPLSVLKSYAEMISISYEDPDRVRKYAGNIAREVDRLNSLAGELLDYSRGEIRLEMQAVNIPDFLKRVETYVRDRMQSRSIELVVSSEVDHPVIMDEERMLRVILNLADNARKAMSSGGRFEVTVTGDGEMVRFGVSDTGEGMPPDVLEHIFEPFYSKSQSGGTGLGMVIVKNVVEAHQGSLRVDSGPKEGTTVTITLPSRI
jgi:signal transduction histidine kinase